MRAGMYGTHTRHNLERLGLYAFLIAYAAFTLFPMLWVLLTSFKTNVQALATPPVLLFAPVVDNYVNVTLHIHDFGRVFLNSTVVALASTACILALGTPASYGLSRFVFRGSGILGFSILSTRTVPRVAIAIPLFLLMKNIGLLDTWWALILANVAYSLPFGVWMIVGFVEAIPLELEDAARIDGCGRFGTFVRIVLPLIVPGMGATAILTTIVAWNEFLMPLVMTSRDALTLPVVVGQFMTEYGIDWGQLSAFAMFTILPVVLATVFVERYLIGGLTAGAVKG
jgi:ABC-type glycerol-3-phosphate transport system permease component